MNALAIFIAHLLYHLNHFHCIHFLPCGVCGVLYVFCERIFISRFFGNRRFWDVNQHLLHRGRVRLWAHLAHSAHSGGLLH